MRGHSFEARAKADGGTELVRLLHERLRDGTPAPGPGSVDVPDLTASGPEGRTARTALALREATAAGRWALLDHPLLALPVSGTPAFLEPDAVVVHPDGSWTVVEIKSFPVIDGAADPGKVGAAARQAAVYVLALEELAARTAGGDAGGGVGSGDDGDSGHGRDGGDSGGGARVRHEILLVCPKDFANVPVAELVDVRKPRATTRRQLARLARVEDIAAALPAGTTFDLRLADDGRTATRPAEELAAAVEAVDAAYAPECLAACELAFHCRARARAEGAVAALGRGLRGELGGLTTVESVLAAALDGTAGGAVGGGPASPGASADAAPDPTVVALRRAAALRSEALALAPFPAPAPAPALAGTEAACR